MTQSQADYTPRLQIDDGTCCLVCLEDLTTNIAVAYKTKEQDEWALSTFCVYCIKHLRATQYHRYINSLKTTNCAKEQRALLDRGPPINVSDKNGFPLADKGEVYFLFDIGAGKQMSPRLEGSLIGEEREQLWKELSKFRFTGDNED